MRKGKISASTIAFLVLLVPLLLILRTRLGGVAPTPAAFTQVRTLDDALAQSEQTGKPVLAFATADWCGACQAFKRGALADEKVTQWINANTIPVYIDMTHNSDPQAQQASRLLGVRAVPLLVLLDSNTIYGRLEGGTRSAKLMSWFEKVKTASLASTSKP